MQEAWKRGDVGEAMALNRRLMPLHAALFVESSPAPVKYAASRLGLCADRLRLPLTSVTPASRRCIDEALASLGLGRARAAAAT